MAVQRVVTGPVVVLPQAGTRVTGYYYQGSVLPDGLDEERVKAVIADGLVREDVKVEELTIEDLSAVSAGDRLRAVSRTSEEAPAVVVTPDGVEHVGELPASAAVPAKAANKDAWVDFAVTQGATREDAEKASKQELIDAYGA